MRYITVILTIAFFMVSQLNAQEAIPLDRIDKVASEALGTFHKIINEQNYQ